MRVYLTPNQSIKYDNVSSPRNEFGGITWCEFDVTG